jgi:hypothetical protein
MERKKLGTVWTVGELRELLLPFTDTLKLEVGTTVFFEGDFPDYRINIVNDPHRSK